MDNFTLLVDSGSDYEPYLAAYLNHPIRVIPLHLYIDGTEYLDGVDITKTGFYKKMEESKELPKTSQPTPHNFYEIFREELDKGNKVMYVGISGKLSGTIQSANIAKQMLEDDEQKNIYIVDSQNVSAGILFVLFKADELLHKGLQADEVVKELEIFRTKVKLFAVLDTLENLRKGGRVNMAQAAFGGLLNIKPLITIDDGLVVSLEKFRGRKKAVNYLNQFINNPQYNIDKTKIFLVHSIMDEESKNTEASQFELGNFKEVIHLKIGTTIGTHAGTDAIGYVFVEQ